MNSTDTQANKSHGDSSEAKFHLLLAEDDDSLREALKEALDAPQRSISLYKNGKEAIQGLKKSRVDVVIADLMMPGADGLSVLRQAKEINPEIVVILMTGYASLDTALQAIHGGAYDYIRKPFKLEELEIAVTNACEKIYLIRENKRLLRYLQEARSGNYPQMPSHPHGERIPSLPPEEMDEEISGMNLILNQMIPAEYDLQKKECRPILIRELEKLIHLRQKGFIDGNEFSAFKKILLKSL